MALSLPPPNALKQGEDFNKWMDSVEIYMNALNITKDLQRKCIVLHLLGPQIQEIYRNLPRAVEQSEDSFKNMKEVLRAYFKPATNHVVERHMFNQMKFCWSTVEKYVAKLSGPTHF